MKHLNKRSVFLRLLFAALVPLVLSIWTYVFEGSSSKDMLIMAGLGLALFGVTLLPRRLPVVPAVLIFLAAPAGYFMLGESISHVVWTTMEMDAVRLNLYFYYMLAVFLFFLTGRASVALIIEDLFVVFIFLAEYFVVLFRSVPIQPWDLLSFGTAAEVAGNYTYSITWLVAEILMGFVIVLFLAARCGKLNLSFLSGMHRKWFGLLIRVVLACLLLIPGSIWVNYLQQPDITDKTSLDATLFTPKVMYRTNGGIVTFVMNLQYINVKKPDGYTTQTAEALLDEQNPSTEVPKTLPNVVFIMNECFSDPSVLGEFETNVPYLTNVQSLLDGAENTVSGYAYASVLGGNTANSEFEFLTGNSMAFLPTGSVPYQQYIFSDVDSVVDQFNELGYTTTAMHPYYASGWNRKKVYSYMHFDDQLFINDFKNVVKLRKYVDDASDYQNVLRILESNDTPSFIANVTMQNHSGYGTEFDNFTPEVKASFKNTKSNKYLNNYLSLIKIADEAIGELLEELKTFDEPTIVVFFGDHQPNDYVVKPIYVEQGIDIDNLTLAQQQEREKVPFFIWANYDIEEQTGLSISLNYINSLLFKTAGLPMSDFQEFCYTVWQQIPVLNAIGILDQSGTALTRQEATSADAELLHQYEILQYYRLFDKEKN